LFRFDGVVPIAIFDSSSDMDALRFIGNFS
jgi:hypothetical protein